MMQRMLCLAPMVLLGASPAVSAEVQKRSVNDGNIVLEAIPEIPRSVVEDLNRYQNVRAAWFLSWSADGESIFVNTRFGDVNQIHRVDGPAGARHQLTFFDEPISEVAARPGSRQLAFTMDAGGNEFSQIFMLDAESGDYRMISDGESRNSVILWDRAGERLAFQSTRRDGRANDIWLMNPDQPRSASVAVAASDGTWWGPVAFDSTGKRLLALRYYSITESEIHLIELNGDKPVRVDGDAETPGTNYPVDFDAGGKGFYFITSRSGEFNQLAYRDFDAASATEFITADIPWDIELAVLDEARRRGAFVANEDGYSALYLFDPAKRRYRRVQKLPAGVIAGLDFAPDSTRLAVTLSTPDTPNDAYVLELGRRALDSGSFERWTFSEVGGLDTRRFVAPELIHYPTFDRVNGEPRRIPAFVYRPHGDGPFPVIVSIHGGPESQARPYFSSTYQMWLAKLGAAVIVPNVRGSAGYGKSYLKLDNGYRREDSVRDIGALLDWIAAEPSLDQSRVAVFGGSYGGYMVLASAVHFSDRLAAAVDVVGISNFVTFLENTEDYRRDLRRQEYGDERDPEMRAFLQRISPLNNIERIRVPLFVVQGQNDPRVPVTEAEQIVAALRAANQEVWYMNALNEGHGYQKKENRNVYEQAVMMFFAEHLL